MHSESDVLTVEQVLEDLILDVQVFIRSRATHSPDSAACEISQSADVPAASPSFLASAVQPDGSTSTLNNTKSMQRVTASHNHNTLIASESSNADMVLTATNTKGTAALQQQPSAHESPLHGLVGAASWNAASNDGTADTDAIAQTSGTSGEALQQQASADDVQSVTSANTALRHPDNHDNRSSKLLALKKHRLDSLSSSLDLSRESSFDTSTFSIQQAATNARSVRNSLDSQIPTHGENAPTMSLPTALQQASPQNSPPLESTSGLEGRSVMLQRRASSISKKPSSLLSMLPSFESTRPPQTKLLALQQPCELSVPLREATATAKTHNQIQEILTQRHHAVMRQQQLRQQRREAAERTQHAEMLEALLEESSKRRSALEARQAARAAQLLARQEQMAAAAEARRKERLQHIGHLPPVAKPPTRKEELQQLHKIEEAEANLRKLLAEHKQMYTAEQQHQEQEEHQQAAAQHRTEEARHRVRRQELDNYAPSWGFRSPAEQPSQEEGTPLPSIISRKVGAGSTIQQAQQQLHNSRLYDHVPARVIQQQQEQSGLWNDTAAAQRAFRKEAQRRRVQQKEFHAKQSTRQRQQEYDQAVKARLAQGSDSSPVTAHRRRHTDSNVPIVASQFRSDLPHIVPAVSGSTSTLQGPRAKRLQAIARQPRPPTELVRPPRQMSRIPDDVFLPDIASSLPGRAANTVQLMGEQSPRLNRILSTENDDCAVDLPAVLLPQLSSQRSRRLTQELPRLGSQVSMAMA